MKKKTEWRICSICGERKRTTNTDIPYIGRECYRTKGRKALLAPKMRIIPTPTGKQNPTKGLIIMVVIFIIGFLVGKFVF